MQLPVFEENRAIAAGLPIERGATLKVFEWREYLAPNVIRSFEQRYRAFDVRVQVSSFEDRSAGAATVARPGSDLDVFFPTVDQLGQLVQARLLRPLTHEYLTNLSGVWPAFGGPGPFYDAGAGYTVPYTVFSTGIGWRRDLVRPQDAPSALADPCDIFANPRYRGMTGVLDAYREPLAMVLQMQTPPTGVNTSDAAALARAADELIGFARSNGLRATADGDYEGLGKGEFAVHQAWSGDVLAARRFSGAPPAATDAHLAYWWMQDGGVVGSDLLAVLSTGKNPVLAHLFLDHLLDLDVAMRNFAWNGYQPPLIGATSEAFASSEWGRAVPEHLLRTAILSPAQFAGGRMLLPLSPATDSAWIEQWRRFTASTPA